MLRAKKTATAAPAPAQEVATPMAVDTPTATQGATSTENGGSASTISLLGIAGQSVKSASGKTGKKRMPAELRIQKDLAELDGGDVATMTFPNPNDLTNFSVAITPQTGLWQGATYNFSFAIPADYPHTPPKITCNTRILHPNIDFQGNVCLNILRADWKPILDINAVIYGLIYLFYEPNPDDPLNREAAELFRNDIRQFERIVQQTLRGMSYGGVTFERLKR